MNGVRMLFYLEVTALGGLCFTLFLREPVVSEQSSDLVEMGRAVYISEGCVHCHSPLRLHVLPVRHNGRHRYN